MPTASFVHDLNRLKPVATTSAIPNGIGFGVFEKETVLKNLAQSKKNRLDLLLTFFSAARHE